MELKDLFYLLSIIITAALTIYNFINNRKINNKTIFINTITTERVKWLDKLRGNISTYIGKADTYTRMDQKDYKLGVKLLEDMSSLKSLIQLQLNPNNEDLDGKLEQSLKNIFNYSVNLKNNKLKREIENTIDITQKLLKHEWEKVKKESKNGDLSEDN